MKVREALLLTAAALSAAIAGCGGDDAGAGSTTVAQDPGLAIFTTVGCSECHTLAAAGATGPGPNLDVIQPTFERAVDAVTRGRAGMPSFRETLSPTQIEQVARWVSDATGPPEQP